MPTDRWPGAASGFLTEASAVALLACSAWLIVYASEQPPVMFLGAAVVGVRAFALSRAAFRYTERLASHDAALRQLAQTRTDLVRRVIPLAPDGLARTRRGSVLGALVDDVDELHASVFEKVLSDNWKGEATATVDATLAVVGRPVARVGGRHQAVLAADRKSVV